MTEAEVKQEIATAFAYAYRHDDWITPLDEALADLNPAQARWSPRPDIPSIWEIVLHLALWNENIVERIERGNRSHPNESWPALPYDTDSAGWEAARERLRVSYAAIALIIETTSLDRLTGGYGLADLLCRLTHSGYHLGQITKLREWGSF